MRLQTLFDYRPLRKSQFVVGRVLKELARKTTLLKPNFPGSNQPEGDEKQVFSRGCGRLALPRIKGKLGYAAQIEAKFLEGLTPHELKLVVEAAEYQRFPENYVVTNQDHRAKYLYSLLTGRAKVFLGAGNRTEGHSSLDSAR